MVAASPSVDASTRPPADVAFLVVLASIAGFVNSVALLVWAFPVGNLTALTTQAGMHSTYPLLYQGRMIAAIVLAFFAGASAAGAVLAFARAALGPGHALVLVSEAALLLAAAGFEQPILRAALAASACGLQNGMTSNFSGMPIRTTHFTGTITDLGLVLGRSARRVVETRNASVLAMTVVAFVAGAAAGVLIGNRIGDHALVVAAWACVVIAALIAVRYRRQRRHERR